jgi:glycosyltransferase involved in cell wall biosynthesis
MSIPIRYAVGKRSKIIYNVQDLFPDSLIPYFGDRRYSILHKVEIASYQAADSISTICYEFYKKIQLRSHKISRVIHNWVDCNEIHYIDKGIIQYIQYLMS